MTRDQYDQFEYDVALSFIDEDKAIAEEFTRMLTAKNIKVFQDEHSAAELSGMDLVLHVAELYRIRARYCVMLISRHYPLQKWTAAERTSAREHALRDPDEYLLPVTLDDTNVPGITETTGYRDLRQHPVESIVDFIEQRLTATKGRSPGPPSKSHDLRSGNVPSKDAD